MNKEHEISVITPSFRQVDYLRKCAASVADQKAAFHHEHLVQDGGSGEDFEKWAARQTFADVRKERDDGMYDAINKGFLRAKGGILAWLNCDEQYLPGTLEKVTGWFEEHPDHDLLFGDVVITDPDGWPITYRKAVAPIRSHIRHCILPTFSAATFVRRKVIDEGYLLSTKFRAISDQVWIDTLLSAGFRAGVLNEPLATFALTGDNLGQSEVPIREGEEWKSSIDCNSKVGRTFWSLVHRWRKFACGAYSPREVEIAIHIDDESGRIIRRGHVGGLWKLQAPTGTSSAKS